jgi:pimeloyl-ACP methyl ester carboxylesterase
MGQTLIDLPRASMSAERTCPKIVEGSIDAPGARLRVRFEGDGPALVLLHGWALDLDMWTPQFDALSAAYRVVAFDRRGFGHSTGAPSIERDVEDLALVMDRLAIERAAVLGMSQGARVALRFALAAPRRTACLILDGAPPMFGAQSTDPPLREFRELVSRAGLEAFRQAWRDHPLTRICSRDAEARALVVRMIDRYRGLDLQARPTGAEADARSPDVRGLHAPTLLINGALDTAERLAAAEDLARRLPQAASIRIAGAAHLPNLDRPHAYNMGLRTFLKRYAGNP